MLTAIGYIAAFLAGVVVTALAKHDKTKAALLADLAYLRRKYEEHTGHPAPVATP